MWNFRANKSYKFGLEWEQLKYSSSLYPSLYRASPRPRVNLSVPLQHMFHEYGTKAIALVSRIHTDHGQVPAVIIMRMKTYFLLSKSLHILEYGWASILQDNLPHSLTITLYPRRKPKSGTAKVIDDKTSFMCYGTAPEGVGKIMEYSEECLSARK